MKSSFESTAADLCPSAFRPDVPGHFERAVEETSPAHDEAEALEVQERLHAEAFESGREQGLTTAQTQCEPALRALSAAAAELSAQCQAYLPAQRRLIVELAVEIAEQIIGRELAASPESIIDRIAAALTLSDPNPALVVELNPKDHSLASEACESTTLPEHLQLVANSELAAGDFLVTNGSTTIDSRLASLLERTRQALAGLETLPETIGEENAGEKA